MVLGVYRRHTTLVWLVLLLSPLAILLIGSLLLPDIFWDEFLYKYFWGPVVADKKGGSVDGILEGYNIINTVVYAFLLALALLGGYKAASRWGLEVDKTFIVSALPIFLLGGVTRALEDAYLFDGWIQYFFISPLIYFLVGAAFLVSGTAGYLVKRKAIDKGQRTVVFSLLIAAVLLLFYAFNLSEGEQLAYLLPFPIPVVLGMFTIALFHHFDSRDSRALETFILCIGLFFLLLSLSYVLAFTSDTGWQALYAMNSGESVHLRAWEFFIIPGIAAAITATVYGAGRLFESRRISVLATPVNLIMFFSHLLDGAATYRGIDLYGYGEKHVLPTFLIDVTGTAASMLLLKFVMVLLLIYLIDVLFREELARAVPLGNVMKFAIIFLGLAPGARDTVRIALGV